MTATINHLKNRDVQRGSVIEVSFGRVVAAGDLCFSRSEGIGATLQMYGFNALGEGEWDGIEAGWYGGLNLPPSEYHFHAGAHATGMTTGPQIVDSWFPKDVPHSRRATIGFRAPLGVGDADTEKNPPLNFFGIFRTKKTPNLNNLGAQIDFGYSTNPARCLAELFLRYARIPNLPTIYQNFVDYWIRRIDWGCWTVWRDYLDSLESVDYTLIPDFEGFGLTTSFFGDTTFSNLKATWILPSINFVSSPGAPDTSIEAANFSVRSEGKLKAKYTETYTFTLLHDDGAKLWVNGVLIIDQAAAGTHTGTANLTANQFYDVKIEWTNGGGNAALTLSWQSTSQPLEVIPSKAMYPKPAMMPRYTINEFFRAATTMPQAMARILFLSNSLKQDVNGKLRFFSLEQITPTFEFNSSNIIEGTFNFETRDVLKTDPITEYEATMRAVDSQFLEEPTTPVSFKVDWLTSKTIENVKVINVANTTRWQARKILQHRAKLEMARGIVCNFDGNGARTYPPMNGSLVTINHRKTGAPKTFLVADAVNKGSADGTIPNRNFKVQEWV